MAESTKTKALQAWNKVRDKYPNASVVPYGWSLLSSGNWVKTKMNKGPLWRNPLGNIEDEENHLSSQIPGSTFYGDGTGRPTGLTGDWKSHFPEPLYGRMDKPLSMLFHKASHRPKTQDPTTTLYTLQLEQMR